MDWRSRDTALALCALAYFGTRFSEFVVSPLVPSVTDGLGTTTGVLGVGFTAMTAGYALVQLPSGMLGDRVGERRVVLGSLAATAIGSLGLALAPSPITFVLAMTLLGLATGVYYTPATTLLTNLHAETGRAIGVHRIGGQAVGLTAPVVALVGVQFGWRVALALGAVVAVPVLVGFAALVRPVPRTDGGTARPRPDVAALVELLSRRDLALATGIASLGQFADVATFSFLLAVLEEHHGFAPATAGALFALYFAVLTIGQPAVGWLSDEIGRGSTTVSALAAGAFGYVLLAVRTDLVAAALATCLVGVGMTWSPPVQSRIVDTLNADERGVGFGLVRTVYILVGSLGGVVVGSVATRAGWSAALSLLAGCVALGALLAGAEGTVANRVE
ncbi:MFS transporter [Halomarina pelagica]|uniref:MFS transporter n=1 Tax=Halomarina pelagica TaxID=2961599 RepID=UPI0020C457B7|nr:MFS transporter [Halomarina sp. BND7]